MASDSFNRWCDVVMRCGPISPLRLGMKQEEVITAFGEPDDVSTMKKKGKPLILKYGETEDGSQVRLSITREDGGRN